VTAAGRAVEAGAVLLAGHLRLRSALPGALGLETTEAGLVAVDAEGRSSDSRVWVAGTAAQPHLMLAESMGSGARVGVSVHRDLCLTGAG
jgi:thioredoxin reductase